MSPRQSFHMNGKLGPACETVFTGEGKLRLGKGASATRRLTACVQVFGNPINRTIDPVTYLGGRVRAVPVAGERDVEIMELHERLDPLCRPRAESKKSTDRIDEALEARRCHRIPPEDDIAKPPREP
jgi:hypothetical protein